MTTILQKSDLAADSFVNNSTNGAGGVALRTDAGSAFRAELALDIGASLIGFIQPDVGAVPRTLQSKGEDVLSVKDYASLQEAVDAALAAGATLNWPAGNYTSTTNITNFHAVRHTGAGVIVRGTDTFYISPTPVSVNKLYVSNTGSSANDGLSPTSAISTLQGAINKLPLYGPVLKGFWVIQLAAGTYARGRFPDAGLQSENLIEVAGPDVAGHPNVPTAIITEGTNGITAEAIRIRNRTRVKCSNLHFIGFNGSTSSGGFTSGGYCEMYSVNCHYTNCTWGISCSQHSLLDVKGGIFTECGFNALAAPYPSGGGIRGLFLSKFSVGTQNAGVLTNGPVFTANNFGVFAQEHIDGHLDWCTFEDNRASVRLNICSRLNMDGSSFVRTNGAAVWAQENSVISLSPNNVFGSGVDENTINIICNTGAVCNPDVLVTTTLGYATAERCVARAIVNQTVSSTSATVIYTLPLTAQLWRDVAATVSGMKKIRFKMFGTLTGTLGYKRPQMRFGATAINATFTASETGVFECEGEVFIGNNPVGTQVQLLKAMRFGGTGTRVSTNTPVEDMTADTAFSIEALVENAADSITIVAYEVWIDGL